MWIFDEILPKSQSSTKSSGTGTSWQDPIKAQPIVISESEPIITSHDILETIEKQPEQVMKIEENTSVLIEETPESILSEIDKNNDPVAFFDQVNSTDSEKTEQITSSPISEEVSSPFFGMMNEHTPVEELRLDSLDSVTENTSFQDTNEYIDHALSGVNTLMENLDKADAKKLAEEDEYTHQKEHFTELAIQAEAEHQKILAEKAHAEKVKAYLEQEKRVNETHTESSNKEVWIDNEQIASISQEIEVVEVPVEVQQNSPEPDIEALISWTSSPLEKKEEETSISL